MIPYFIDKGEFLMVIMLAVVLIALFVLAARRRCAGSCVNENEVPEEVLAELMPGEYPVYYRKAHEIRMALRYPLP